MLVPQAFYSIPISDVELRARSGYSQFIMCAYIRSGPLKGQAGENGHLHLRLETEEPGGQ